MASEWSRGVLTSSSWHQLEEVGAMPTAVDMILAGEKSGAWPVKLRTEGLYTKSGLTATRKAVVAEYRQHDPTVVGVVGDRYRATTPQEWRDFVTAADAAGAKPTGAFSLREGTRVLATFEIGTSNGIKTQLLLADSFDGSMRLTCGFTAIRVVCANTLAMSLDRDGEGMAQIRHTASLEEKIRALTASIGTAIATGEKVKSAFHQAEHTQLNREQAIKAFDALFPEADKNASPSAITRADNERDAAKLVASLPINRVGNKPGNLATLWNAATYLVDRNQDGTNRASKGGDGLDSLLFGARAKRVQEVQTIIECIMRDGSVQQMNQTQALAAGVAGDQVGRAVIADLLAD